MKHSYSTEENNKHKNNAFSKIISYYSTRSFSNSVKLSSTENGLLSSNTTRKHILASCSFLFYFYRLCWLFFFFSFLLYGKFPCATFYDAFSFAVAFAFVVAFEVHCRIFLKFDVEFMCGYLIRIWSFVR